MAVTLVLDDESEYDLLKKYSERSVQLQMDPYQIPRCELVYGIQVEDMGQGYMLGTVYEDLINNVQYYQWIEEQTDIVSTVVSELVSVDAKSTEVVLNGAQSTSSGNDSMRIILTHADENECAKLVDATKSYLEQQQALLAQEFCEHELVLLAESTGCIMNTAILNNQINHRNAMLTLQNTIAKAKDAFTDEQKLYYGLLADTEVALSNEETDTENTSEPQLLPAPVPPSVSVKHLVLGAILFAFVYVIILFVLYIMNGKLRATDDFSDLYQIPQLGFIAKTNNQTFIIDKWINHLRYYGTRRFTPEQAIALACTAIKISATKNELEHICLIGCDMESGARSVCDNLASSLAEVHIKVTVLDNILYDASSMEQLESAKGIVLVEKAGSTMYQEIAKELELAKRQDVKILGGIIVE